MKNDMEALESGLNFRFVEAQKAWMLLDRPSKQNEAIMKYIEPLLASNGVSIDDDVVMNIRISTSASKELLTLKANILSPSDELWLSLYAEKPAALQVESASSFLDDLIFIYKEPDSGKIKLHISLDLDKTQIDSERLYNDLQRYLGLEVEFKRITVKEVLDFYERVKVHSFLKFDPSNLVFRRVERIRVGQLDVIDHKTSSKSATKLLIEIIKLYTRQDV